MAENESLDLYYKNSGRWRGAMRMMADGLPADRVAEELLRNLYRTMKNLIKNQLLSVEALYDAATGRRDDLELVVRQAESTEYARLFAANAFQGLGPVEIVENVLRDTTDRFLDQMGVQLVGGERFAHFAAFRRERDEITYLMNDGVRQLAHTIAQSPRVPPRMPALSVQRRRQAATELMTMSLLGQ